MSCVGPDDPDYNKDRAIANARFNYFPKRICYCKDAGEVSQAIKDAITDNLPVRIRSGGHQHEGMCSGNGVVVIDLSPINQVKFLPGDRAWIGAGCSLTYVYAFLWHNSFIFPGGGCGDVHVGGLTHGGGWGPQGRLYGLTCDSLVGVEIVTATGDVLTVTEEGSDRDRKLLRALRGGGGGNFGVVTKFLFRIHRWPGDFTSVTLTWDDERLRGDRLERFIQQWVTAFPRDVDLKLTTFLRLSTLDQSGGARVVVGGRYVGNIAAAKACMERLLAGQPAPIPDPNSYQPVPRTAPVSEGAEPAPHELALLQNALGPLRGYQPGPAPAGGLTALADADLNNTCAGVPLKHKISSGFARLPFAADAVRVATRIVRDTVPSSDERLYLSFHSLGGLMNREELPGSYAFRDRDVLLQFQAWWQPDSKLPDGPRIDWIEKFRRALSPYTDGAFINFVDRDIPLPEYYKVKFPELIGAKQEWDKGDFFKFEMSIPTTG